jgi:predicted Zn-dependent protease
LKVFLPEHQAQDLDFREACLATMDIWNMIMGEDYFVVVANSGDADVEFLFENMGPDANGQTSLLEPDDQDYHLGDVIPQRMRVRINDQQEDLQRIQETSLHELGHVLGLNRHLLCNQPGYLMYVTAAGVLDDGPENAIHIDEQRAVRAIRYLPQGYDLGGF